jgi:hypothetical protein
VSPILVRPVREQFEHDRVIRVLQAKYKRKYEVIINPGSEQNASVSVSDLPMFPDLVLFSTERGKKLQGTVDGRVGSLQPHAHGIFPVRAGQQHRYRAPVVQRT